MTTTTTSRAEASDAAGKSKPEMSSSNSSNVRLMICVGGVFCCYFVYGLIQEKITRGTFGEAKERFTYVQCLVFAQCVVNALFAKVSPSLLESGRFELVKSIPFGREGGLELRWSVWDGFSVGRGEFGQSGVAVSDRVTVMV